MAGLICSRTVRLYPFLRNRYLYSEIKLLDHQVQQFQKIDGPFAKFKTFGTAPIYFKDSKNNDSPIAFSTSPLKNYKSNVTFGGSKIEKEPSAKPMIVGGGLFLVLMCVIFLAKGDRFDPFSKEFMAEIEKKLALEPDGNSTEAKGQNKDVEEGTVALAASFNSEEKDVS